MNYAFLANATATTHFAINILVIVGLLACFRYKRFRPWEAGLVVVVLLLWSYYGNCPLTILEQYFREMAGQNTNLTSVGFLPYYAERFFNFELSSRVVQRFTFFTGGALFVASIEWLAPVMHMEIFKFRKALRKVTRRYSI